MLFYSIFVIFLIFKYHLPNSQKSPFLTTHRENRRHFYIKIKINRFPFHKEPVKLIRSTVAERFTPSS